MTLHGQQVVCSHTNRVETRCAGGPSHSVARGSGLRVKVIEGRVGCLSPRMASPASSCDGPPPPRSVGLLLFSVGAGSDKAIVVWFSAICSRSSEQRMLGTTNMMNVLATALSWI